MRWMDYMRRAVSALLCLLIASCAGAGVLYEANSAVNGRVIVQQDTSGRRTLAFGEAGATQSAMDVHHPQELVLAYTKSSMMALAFQPKPQRILIIGLGGASMPKYLRKTCPDATIQTVELDPVVVDIARRYFEFAEDDRMKVHIGDGRKFIETSKEKFDLIFLDAYGENAVPYDLATQEFLKAVRARLTDRGLAISNLWGNESNELYWSMLKTHQSVFDELHIFHPTGTSNRVVLALTSQRDLDRATLTKLAKQNAPKELALEKTIEESYEQVDDLPAEAKILRDADAPSD